MPRLLIILILAVTAGCSSVPDGRIVHSLYGRVVVLSTEHSEDAFLKARLISIADDGTTRIQTRISGEILQASIGGYFVGTNNAYGSQGLRLVSASHQAGEARFMRMWCEATRR